MPYGFASVVPVGESAVVLPLANGEVSLGVLAKMLNLMRARLCSRQRAERVLC